jgi:hypothetical protein
MKNDDKKIEIERTLGEFNGDLNKVIVTSEQFKNSPVQDIHTTLEYRGIWSGTTYQPHDVINIDEEKQTFEIATSAATAPLQLMIDLAMIAINPFKEEGLFKESVLAFIKEKMGETRYSELNESLVKIFDTSYKNYSNNQPTDPKPLWYVAIDKDSEKKLTVDYYATSSPIYKYFMCMPVLLADSVHDKKHDHNRPTSMPVGTRGLFQLTEGWLLFKDKKFTENASATTFRSGALSRNGNEGISNQNARQMKTALGKNGEVIQLVSASLLTKAITKAAKVKAFFKGRKFNEPDQHILDAQHDIAKKNKNHRHRNAGVILKTMAKGHSSTAYNINPDPFGMMDSFRKLTLNNNCEMFKNYPSINSLYSSIQGAPKPPADNNKSNWIGFEVDMMRSHNQISEQFRSIKNQYAEEKDPDLLKQIRLLEGIYTHQLISINHAKKHRFGKLAVPVIETPLEYFSKQQGLGPLENNQYDQWLLALENIIGNQYDALNLVKHGDEPSKVKIITHFYCKDGRDRTGITAILFKFLNTQFDAGVSTLANNNRPDLRDTPALSMIPTDDLKNKAPAFKEAHDRIVRDHSSAMLCGSPESSIGCYGLLSKLQGAAMGIVATAIAPVRSALRSVMTASANLFDGRILSKRNTKKSISDVKLIESDEIPALIIPAKLSDEVLGPQPRGP